MGFMSCEGSRDVIQLTIHLSLLGLSVALIQSLLFWKRICGETKVGQAVELIGTDFVNGPLIARISELSTTNSYL
jgi:hypothetical protein